MSEIFSNKRLADYFVKFETEVTGYNINHNIQNLNNLDFKNLEESPLIIDYTFSNLYKLPKKDYKNTYELDLSCIIEMLPTEHVFIKKPPNKFFSLVFVNGNTSIFFINFIKKFKLNNIITLIKFLLSILYLIINQFFIYVIHNIHNINKVTEIFTMDFSFEYMK